MGFCCDSPHSTHLCRFASQHVICTKCGVAARCLSKPLQRRCVDLRADKVDRTIRKLERFNQAGMCLDLEFDVEAIEGREDESDCDAMLPCQLPEGHEGMLAC